MTCNYRQVTIRKELLNLKGTANDIDIDIYIKHQRHTHYS